MKENPIRILVVDDHAIVREGLRWLMLAQQDMELVGEAANGEEAVSKAVELQPDVILMDLVLPGKSGIDAIREIKAANPNVRILVLTSFADDDKVFPAIKMGALGYLLKDTLPQELLQAVRSVYRGQASLHPTIALRLISEVNHPQHEAAPTKDPLTGRELEVLVLVAQGLTNLDIGDKLGISEWTVRSHISSILSKLHLANRTQAALYALKEGLASLEG